jgi:hypothetical protein
MKLARRMVAIAGVFFAFGLMSQSVSAQQAAHTWFVFDHTAWKCEQAPGGFTPDSVKAELKKQGAPVGEKTLNDKRGHLAMLAVVNKTDESGMAFFTTLAVCNFIAQKDPALVGN